MNVTGPELVDETSHAAFEPGNPEFISHIKRLLTDFLYYTITFTMYSSNIICTHYIVQPRTS